MREGKPVLTSTQLATTDEFELRDVRCRSNTAGWSSTEVPATLDLAHRRLLATARSVDASEATERVSHVVSSLLERVAPARVQSGRPATVAARARLVADAREALATDPSLSLVELARSGSAARTLVVERWP